MGMCVQQALSYGWQLASVPPEGRGASFALIRPSSLRGVRHASYGSEPRTRNGLEVRPSRPTPFRYVNLRPILYLRSSLHPTPDAVPCQPVTTLVINFVTIL